MRRKLDLYHENELVSLDCETDAALIEARNFNIDEKIVICNSSFREVTLSALLTV